MKRKVRSLFSFIIFYFLFLSQSFAQDSYLHGIIVNSGNVPVASVSILIKGTRSGTSTDANGAFTLKTGAEKKLTLVISSVGYSTKEISVATENDVRITIQLEEETKTLDDLIVTGVFDKRKRIESSIAITTIPAAQLEHIIPNSSSELLRLVPGIFVNSARGEIANSVYSRGMILDGSYYYVSMQEDGLPVIPFSGTMEPDGFLRADINIQKIEAVRGGSASILGVNAPGGIFNYISKTGTNKFEGNIVSRFGLEGNGKNPYYKLEVGLGGPLSKKDSSWTYYVGGHYRYANGPKYPGYPLSKGGQVKGNIQKIYSTGSLKLNIKWLDDRTESFEFTPSRDFDHTHPAGNFDNTSSVLIPAVHVNIPSLGDGLRAIDYDSKNLNHFLEKAISLHWQQRLGKGWKMQHAIRLSDKSSESNGTLIVYPFQVNDIAFFAINGLLFHTGTYRFFDARSGKDYGTVTQALDFTQPVPFKFTSDLHLPGAEIAPNSLFYTPFSYNKTKLSDIVYQGSVTKTTKAMKFTGGLFLSKGSYKSYLTPPAAQGYTTIEDRPRLVAIEYTPDNGDPVNKVTDQHGAGWYGTGGMYANDIKLSQNAFFFGHQWDITPKLNLDWGWRYEWFGINNTYTISNSIVNSTTGGIDKDPLTLYDNAIVLLNAPKQVKKTLTTFSISGGLNYKANEHVAYYVRYSLGNKLPNVSNYITNEIIASSVKEHAQQTIQLEGGIKYEGPHTRFTVTPFLSILSNVPKIDLATDTGVLATIYPTPIIYNKVHTIGIELEGNLKLSAHFNVRANAVVQQFYSDKYMFYDVRDPGTKDDSLIDRSGKKISDQAPPIVFNLTPSYYYKKWYADINMYYVGKRAANTSETFYLRAFSQFDLHLGYALSKKITLRASINNLFNNFGVMEWTAPIYGGVPFETFATQQFTPERRQSNPNANFFTIAIQPRSYWLDLSIKL
jgi:iron complex outermembrane recepter protein